MQMSLEISCEKLPAQTVGEAAELRTNKHSEPATVLRSPSGQTFGGGFVCIQRTGRTQTPEHFREAPPWALLHERGEAPQEKGRARLHGRVVFRQSKMAGRVRHQPEGQCPENQFPLFR